jgi:hypothetical protein
MATDNIAIPRFGFKNILILRNDNMRVFYSTHTHHLHILLFYCRNYSIELFLYDFVNSYFITVKQILDLFYKYFHYHMTIHTTT